MGHVTRHVFGTTGEDLDETAVRKVAGEVTGDAVRLKAFRDPSVVTGWLDESWWIDPEPGCPMTAPWRRTTFRTFPTAIGCAPGHAAG
ncbi:hypothetical protein [Streptomyces sp. CA-179760]|uniref:hypothetical protein n=1 Tax=Streptomyces sp. CA-179760 TaxID=3240054 RepID=UPI003D92F0F1